MLTTWMSGKWVMGSRHAPETMIGISHAQGRAHGGVNSIQPFISVRMIHIFTFQSCSSGAECNSYHTMLWIKFKMQNWF